jgi:argininosuccinate lyase
MNIMPLGSGALAGNPFSINRSLLAKDLGFAKLTYNSMNAVGNRDFIGQDAGYFHCNIKKERQRKKLDTINFNYEHPCNCVLRY